MDSEIPYCNLVTMHQASGALCGLLFILVLSGFHFYALLVLIVISNKRSKMVNANMTRQSIRQEKYVYLQIFMLVGVSVIEILLFNRKKKQKQKMKNMATL